MFSTLQPVWFVRAVPYDMTVLPTLVTAWSVFADVAWASVLHKAHGFNGGGDMGLVVGGLVCGGTKGRGTVEGIGRGVQS